MKNKTFREIYKIDVAGCIPEKMLPKLAKDHPKCQVLINWERHPASSHYAADAVNVIMNAARNRDYAREVLLLTTSIDKLREVSEQINTE